MLDAIDAELARVREEPVTVEEIERARARLELGLVSGLETADGKASTIGFYDSVLGRPGAAFERLQALERVTASDLRRVARRYFTRERRSVILVRVPKDGGNGAGQ
jgi:zinc protease